MIANGFRGPIERESAEGISGYMLKEIYRTMLLIRVFEERVASLVEAKEVKTPCHLYIGQEAVAAGVCAALEKADFVYSTHRSHGHYIAKGGDIKSLMAEIFCRSTGCSGGYGGSMHVCSPENGLPGSSAIVGGTVPIAVGTALAFKRQGKENVSCAFFGDGAATEGVLYESLNFAQLNSLPVLFVCENNFYSTHMHISKIQSNVELYKRARAFDMPSYRIDGNNAVEVYSAAKKAVDRARGGEGPTFLECLTYRWRGHVGPNWDLDKGIRSREEVEWWVQNCALGRMEDLLRDMGLLVDTETGTMRRQVEGEVEASLLFARNSPHPEARLLWKRVFKQEE
jgi:TPP-dependent pyruvate/acetoin dehydrogenase alpha subunit